MYSRSPPHNIQFQKISRHYIKFIIFQLRTARLALIKFKFTGVALHAVHEAPEQRRELRLHHTTPYLQYCPLLRRH